MQNSFFTYSKNLFASIHRLRSIYRVCAMMLCLLTTIHILALDVPAGTIYFDNSLTNYHQVQFIVGSYSRAESHVFNMQFDGKKWSCTIANPISGMDRYIFAPSEYTSGQVQRTLEDIKNEVSNQNKNRTATQTNAFSSGQIFVPKTGDNWAQGVWMNLSNWENNKPASATISGTLPVLYINTDNGAPIDSKDTYIGANWYLDSLNRTEYNSFGSANQPLRMQIKGRGNWTWNGFDKKPYRIKLEVGQKLCGMHKSKNWALMAAADDPFGYMKNIAGHMISRRLDLLWTPAIVPIELVLNGRYWGLYFLTETVRVDNKRVNIIEQSDNISYADSITGGWLIEIDNYSSEGNITFREGNGQQVMISLHTPELLSTAQRNYITAQVNELNTAIYEASSDHLMRIMDIDEAAKYYLVQEVMEDCESYHGSCFLFKDMDQPGKTTKWTFGPVWDFGNSFWRHQEKFIYDGPSFAQYWIGQLATHQCFQDSLMGHWYNFYREGQYDVKDWLADFADEISQAAQNDAVRWRGTQNYCENSNMASELNDMLAILNWRINWLHSQWGDGTPGKEDTFTPVDEPSANMTSKIMRNGQLLIQRNGSTYTVMGIKIE